MTLLIVSLLLGLILLLTGSLMVLSPGKIEQCVDTHGNSIEGSLAEKRFMLIGGVQQGMFIKSSNINHPVLLYLHGGPAFPNYFLIDKFNPGLEDDFTVCYWEQRGGGLSYTPAVSLESMNFQQLASDAIEVTQYLCNRFGKKKIYLMAHSGGTPIGLLAVAAHPELYAAYIGMGQITDQGASEKIAFAYMLAQFATSGNNKKITALKKFSPLSTNANLLTYYQSSIRDHYMHALGIGTMHQMRSVFWDIFIPVWTCKAYTFSEKVNLWKSKFFFLPKTNLLKEMLETDFTALILSLKVPVYFFSGKYDLTVNINLSKAYLAKLHAQLKGFYTFNYSAHSPLFEEPARVRKIFEVDILQNKNKLADIY